MKSRMGRVLALTCVLVVLAAGAAVAAEQTIEIGVLPGDTLSVEVDGQVGLNTETGSTSDWAEFGMYITNTTTNGWEVKASSTDFLGFGNQECDENGCTYTDPTGINLSPSALEIEAGDFDGWGDPGAIVPSAATAMNNDYTESLLVTGTNAAYGQFQLDDPWSRLRITVPADPGDGSITYAGQYQGTVTYTIYPIVP